MGSSIDLVPTSRGRTGKVSLVQRSKKPPALILSTSPRCTEEESLVWLKELLPSMTTDRVCRKAMEWLQDLEKLRGRSSNIQDTFSRKMKDRIEAIGVEILESRAEDSPEVGISKGKIEVFRKRWRAQKRIS